MAGIFSKLFSQKSGSNPRQPDNTQKANILGLQETIEWMADFIARLSYGQISVDRNKSFLRTPNGMVGAPPKDYASIGEKCGIAIKPHRLLVVCDAGDEGFMTIIDEYNDPEYIIFYNRRSDTYGKLDMDFEKHCSEEEKESVKLFEKNIESFVPTVMGKFQESFPEIKEWRQ